MRISYVELCGFRGYSKPLRIDFARGFTVIDGRNGVGKSSIFDAIEFVLLGRLGKYGDIKAAGEGPADYVWWRGRGPTPTARFVEVGFEVNGEVIPLRRAMIEGPDERSYARVVEALLSAEQAPEEALRQLCNASIIRDEKIAELSLDLRESDRFKLLRDALGASDAETWTERADAIHKLAKRRLQSAEAEVNQAIVAVNQAAQRADETRQLIADTATISTATERLQRQLDSAASGAPLFSEAVERVSSLSGEVERLGSLIDRYVGVQEAKERREEVREEISTAQQIVQNAAARVEHVQAQLGDAPSSAEFKSRVATYASLIAAGRAIGLRDGTCPLCAAERTEGQFAAGLERASDHVASLDAVAVARAEIEQLYQTSVAEHASAAAALERLSTTTNEAHRQITEFESALAAANLPVTATQDEVNARREDIRATIEVLRRDLAIADTRRTEVGFQSAQDGVEEAQRRRVLTEEKLTAARRAEVRSKTILDACKRSSGEVLQKRLEVVMPLMSELYQRLRPHPMWDDISYHLRGDIQKFLTLKVGENLNPQFIYSSGQRRATGLAFLLAVNLSLAWNKLQTLMLDDPVQHIDDFRSVHLAEVLAKLAMGGRQIICAAEDSALANLIARHLPVSDEYQGRRVTLGVDQDGALAVLSEESVSALPRNSFVVTTVQQTAS